MLIDYLEEAAAELGQKKRAYQELHRQYKKFYSKDIRDEIAALHKEMGKKRAEVNERLYEGLRELLLIKRYFPELYAMLLEDEGIGGLVRAKDWLLERKEERKDDAGKRLERIRADRAQLREARKFVEGWPRLRIDAKSICATWPALRGAIKGELDREDVLAAIAKKDKGLVRAGWVVLINESMVDVPLRGLLERVKKLRNEELKRRAEAAEAKGKGSIKEYEALKEVENARRERERMERVCRHILLANPAYLERMKKELKAGRKNKTDLERMASMTAVKKINEAEWLREMRKRLE